MRRDYIEFQDRSFALAYLITFRCYGTWLHGDERGTVGRRGSNVFGSPRIRLDKTLLEIDKRQMAAPPFELGSIERSLVEKRYRASLCGSSIPPLRAERPHKSCTSGCEQWR
jgi:hypothetical protein